MNGLNGLEQRLLGLFDNAAVGWVVLGVALLAGALHALAPGHGKTIAAAYLVGARQRYRDAAVLGGIVAGMHTFSVLVLALVWVGVSGIASLGTEAVTAWLQVVAGVVVIGVGASLTVRQLRRVREPAAHGHGHGHGHGHVHDDGAPWSGKGLVVLGLSGGLLPSPSAFLVLVSGLLTGRAVFAVVLVAAFGVGMAATLTAVGLLAVRGQTALSERAATATRLTALVAWLPVAGGAVVAVGGFLYLVTAVGVLV
ncbi:HoxN/HupN/NixA family nickel/cobalt transporter [Tenggerimyces flavus]|uniref:Nickel/cobalt efflux system n=1 Tax=Tenggerimyces flavus TaxID=1708749 RepID=A0ABV7YN60_9ACTN|nr:cobalt transporter [Tenggerimyces flavus]MBM7784789.1 ABC-type nickel/cobalt efflux system permease component RcnA [Tenggerimyces flavus]